MTASNYMPLQHEAIPVPVLANKNNLVARRVKYLDENKNPQEKEIGPYRVIGIFHHTHTKQDLIALEPAGEFNGIRIACPLMCFALEFKAVEC